LADILRPSLREEDFNTEKQVIIEEIRMYEDQPPFGADEKCRALHYGPHPLGRSVLGTEESINALPVEAMLGYFQKRYSPSNISLIATGRLDFPGLVAAAKRYCGHWDRFDAGRATPPAQPRQGFEVIRKESATQQYTVQLSAGPSAEDDDRYAAKLLATVLGDDTGSRLFWDLVDSGLAEQVSLSHYEYEGAGLFLTYMSCDPELAAENLQRINDLYRNAERDGITREELEQAKSKVSSRVVLSGERPRGRLFSVGGEWVQRRQYRSVRDDLDLVAAVTVDQAVAVLQRYPLTQGATVAIGPLAELRAPE
jgi:predicted Zn-dependent peptidase